ncbi:morphogenic membrane protein MmpA [Streptomyces caeni]|uniref:Morphogenic membrane protein MmpA n=1 Tax=Streptomyces caeni TaxID=2307231 RepID=A0ABW4INX6_9ACTN
MTTQRPSKAMSNPAQPVERAVTAVLLLGVITGIAWIGGMIYTVLE